MLYPLKTVMILVGIFNDEVSHYLKFIAIQFSVSLH